MIQFEQVTLYSGGVQYTLQVSVDMQRIAEALLERAARNKSRRAKVCFGAVAVRCLTQVPLK
jgi:hypothetical protein